MENVAHIILDGTVGIFEGEQGFTIDNVIAQVQGYKDRQIDKFNFKMRGPGGYVKDGEDIFNYMRSLEKDGTVISTEQIGDIGSIMTKLFLAPTKGERLVNKNFGFMIHNPWGQAKGDANEMREYAEELDKEEKKLTNFYVESTGITAEGLKPLMEKESIMTAEEAINYGFATGYTDSETKQKAIAALFKPKHTTMSKDKENQSLLERFKALIKNAEQSSKEDEPKAIDYTLDSGATLRIDAEDDGSIEGASAMVVDADGNESQAPEGSHLLDDGRTVNVNAAGIVESIEDASEDEDIEMAKLKKELAAANEKVENLEKNFKEEVDKAVEAKMKEASGLLEKLEEGQKAVAKERAQMKAMRKIYAIDDSRDFVKELEEKETPTRYDEITAKMEEIKENAPKKFQRGTVKETVKFKN